MNKDSVMAMLEAFVHDPLINWRLLNTVDADADTALSSANTAEPHMPGAASCKHSTVAEHSLNLLFAIWRILSRMCPVICQQC